MDAATRSAYGYVGNDPLNGSDPSGMIVNVCSSPAAQATRQCRDAGGAGLAKQAEHAASTAYHYATGGCVLGHDPNGSCRGSNAGNDVHFAASAAEVTAIVVVLAAAPELAPAEAALLLGGATLAHGGDAIYEGLTDKDGCSASSRCAANIFEGLLDAGSLGVGLRAPGAWGWGFPTLVQFLQWAQGNAPARPTKSCPES